MKARKQIKQQWQKKIPPFLDSVGRFKPALTTEFNRKEISNLSNFEIAANLAIPQKSYFIA